LKSARSERFKSAEGRAQALARAHAHGIEGLIVLGGDGSFRGAMTLEAAGFPCIGIPATIDNDIACTEHCIGFDTAVNTVVDAINKIRDTATSHERIVVVETMGRSSGYIALYAGLAGGAESILIPEAPIDFAEICARVRATQSRDKSHSIVVVAEGAFGPPESSLSFEQSAGFRVARTIREQTGLETRLTILGHLQRGGAPTAIDRIAASRFGEAAVQLLAAGEHGVMVGLLNGVVQASPFAQAVAGQRPLDPAFHRLAGLLASQ
ncbi:MAG TPA: ATP-dependent 6-phosphofructokinase, partial [Limnochordia bacterium]|nr:ATP-dependent 6-phosphofructokinase [Limnochordia bacterium]